MDLRELDAFVSRVLNKTKEEANPLREAILSGNMDLESYKNTTGQLVGLEIACNILMEEAKAHMKETLDD